MQKSELMTKIRAEYLAANPAADTAPIDKFCDFAAQWLSTSGIVGVAIAASGLSLRTTDGGQISLYDGAPTGPTVDTPSVSIGGMTASAAASRGLPEGMPSFQITGS